MKQKRKRLFTPDKLKTSFAVTFFVTERIGLRPRGGRRWSWMKQKRKRLSTPDKLKPSLAVTFFVTERIPKWLFPTIHLYNFLTVKKSSCERDISQLPLKPSIVWGSGLVHPRPASYVTRIKVNLPTASMMHILDAVCFI
ncbi:hypothetical protein [Thalassobacillus pellis]|uniref:hypothetical protein n=1 Tax=Thalassobacillus pellis TaxID=748008 RepID=UPI001961A1F8|nr:hypothetical protein [Thalassobacillus pellis]MBM7552978.1 hypothetical protein [Thalassobacillus pellis]